VVKPQQTPKAAGAAHNSIAPRTSSSAAVVKGAGATAAAAAASAGPRKPVSLATLKAQQRKAGAVGAAAGSSAVKSGGKATAVGAFAAVVSTSVKPTDKTAGNATLARWK
jgi:hypothetical protein